MKGAGGRGRAREFSRRRRRAAGSQRARRPTTRLKVVVRLLARRVGVGAAAVLAEEGAVLVLVGEFLGAHEEHVLAKVRQPGQAAGAADAAGRLARVGEGADAHREARSGEFGSRVADDEELEAVRQGADRVEPAVGLAAQDAAAGFAGRLPGGGLHFPVNRRRARRRGARTGCNSRSGICCTQRRRGERGGARESRRPAGAPGQPRAPRDPHTRRTSTHSSLLAMLYSVSSPTFQSFLRAGAKGAKARAALVGPTASVAAVARPGAPNPSSA